MTVEKSSTVQPKPFSYTQLEDRTTIQRLMGRDEAQLGRSAGPDGGAGEMFTRWVRECDTHCLVKRMRK